MYQRTDRRRHSQADRSGGTEASREELTTELRIALTARTTALAKWQTHRSLCAACIGLEPGCPEGAACRAGRPVLARLRGAHERVRAAREALAPRPAAQLDLFGG